MTVIGELDGLKRRHGREGWRAAYSLAVIDACSPLPGSSGLLREEDFSPVDTHGVPFGRVTVEVWPDPPGHIRMPINDDEIVDRASAVGRLAGRKMGFATYDTGQAQRARAAGLVVHKLELEISKHEPSK
jgi:hypothetical protein